MFSDILTDNLRFAWQSGRDGEEEGVRTEGEAYRIGLSIIFSCSI